MPRSLPWADLHEIFCLRGHLADIVNHAIFHLNQVRGFDSVGVEFLTFP